MEVDIKTVLAAINTLYVDEGKRNKEDLKQASQFLGDLQKTVEAWKIADQLLHMKQDLNSCFFAAQTLRTKIQFNFIELPPEAYTSLQVSMLQHLSHIDEGTSQGITTQLCVALADLALLMVTWEDPIGDLINQFGPNSPKKNLIPLLEVLIALPEEKVSKQLKLGLKRRIQLEEYFLSQVNTIIQLLDVIISGVNSGIYDESIHIKCLRCLSSWFNVRSVDWGHLTKTCIISNMFAIVSNPQIYLRVHEIGTDCVCSAMIMLEHTRDSELTSVLFAGIMQLEPCYEVAVAMEDLTVVTNYARMFAELGETLIDVLVDTPAETTDGCMQILHLIITSVGHHEWEVAEITFNFWYKLSEVLLTKNCDKTSAKFQPYVERFIKALHRHCGIDIDHEGILSETEDFYEFRIRVQELMKDIAFIIGSRPCFVQMSDLVQTQECQENWNQLESALFIMQSVARNLLPQEDAVIPPIVEGILSQSESVHVQVTYTSILLLAELSEWLAVHEKLLPSVLTFLTNRLHNRHLANVVAKALVIICSYCRDHMENHFMGLMHIASMLDGFEISNTAVVDLLKSVATIIGRLPHELVSKHMKELCSLQIKPLQALVQENQIVQSDQSNKRNLSSDPVIWLDRLSAVFRNVNPIVLHGQKHPCLEVVLEIWPTLSAVFHKFSNELRVMEHCCRCVRFAVRCVRHQIAPLLQPLVEIIVALYALNGYSCFVYLGSILVDEYALEPEMVPGLLNMLNELSKPTFSMLTQPNGFREHPDTVDDWFRLCTRFLQRAPLPLLYHEVHENIIQCGLQAALLDHKEASAAVLRYFQDLIDVAIKHDDRPDFEERQKTVTYIMDKHGQSLVNNLITASLFILPSFMVSEVAATIKMIMEFDRPKFCVWLESRLKEIPLKNSGGIEAVTPAQIAELHKTITISQRTKDITEALLDFSRFFT